MKGSDRTIQKTHFLLTYISLFFVGAVWGMASWPYEWAILCLAGAGYGLVLIINHANEPICLSWKYWGVWHFGKGLFEYAWLLVFLWDAKEFVLLSIVSMILLVFYGVFFGWFVGGLLYLFSSNQRGSWAQTPVQKLIIVLIACYAFTLLGIHAFGGYFPAGSWLEFPWYWPVMGVWIRNLGIYASEVILFSMILLLLTKRNRKSLLFVAGFCVLSWSLTYWEKQTIANAQDTNVLLRFVLVPSNPKPPFFPPLTDFSLPSAPVKTIFLLPESAYDGVLEDSQRLPQIIEQELQPNQYLAMGSDRRIFGESGFEYLNSVYFIEGQSFRYVYRSKHYLTPGGEYMPRWLTQLSVAMLANKSFIYTAGKQQPLNWANQSWAVGICYEGLLPKWYSDQLAADQPDFYVVFSREYLFSSFTQKKISAMVALKMFSTGKPWIKVTAGADHLYGEPGQMHQRLANDQWQLINLTKSHYQSRFNPWKRWSP